ncbi:integrator complex subunit 2 homolog [Littorina saxatilis]|uniref:integrator complex subunit 2 homolog n=1 Tax=Littorina saxatilis TaxID=31220 RepID=UPI0038B5AE79
MTTSDNTGSTTAAMTTAGNAGSTTAAMATADTTGSTTAAMTTAFTTGGTTAAMTTASTTGSTTAAMTTAADTTSTTTIAEDTTPATAESTSIAPDITTATGFNSTTAYICDLGISSREALGVSLLFIVRVNINVFDLSNQKSPQYISLREEFRQKMFNYLNVIVSALIDVCVSNLSQGSVIADLTAVVGKNTSEQSASQLTLALRTLDRGQVLLLNNQSGTVDVTTTDGKSFSQVGVCEAFNSIYTCVNGSQCVEENGSPSCTPTEGKSFTFSYYTLFTNCSSFSLIRFFIGVAFI